MKDMTKAQTKLLKTVLAEAKVAPKLVTYEVTNAFGRRDIGDRFKAVCLCVGDNGALLFHPLTKTESRKYECPSFEFCRWDSTRKAYVSTGVDTYLNIA